MSDIAAAIGPPSNVQVSRICVVRIELSSSRRRQLARLASAAGISADDLAHRIVCDALAAAEVKPPAASPAVHPPAPDTRPRKTARRTTRPAPRRPDTREPFEANGVHVDFKRSLVTFRDREVAVSIRQADVVAVLAREMPNIIPRNQICDRAWPRLAPTTAQNTLNILREPLQQRLERIGLTIHVARKLGLALRVVEGKSND